MKAASIAQAKSTLSRSLLSPTDGDLRISLRVSRQCLVSVNQIVGPLSVRMNEVGSTVAGLIMRTIMLARSGEIITASRKNPRPERPFLEAQRPTSTERTSQMMGNMTIIYLRAMCGKIADFDVAAIGF